IARSASPLSCTAPFRSAKAMDLYEFATDSGGPAVRLNWLIPNEGANLEDMILRHQVSVGFLILEPETLPAMEDQLAVLLSRTPDVQWIAVMTPGMLACSRAFDLVSHYCC